MIMSSNSNKNMKQRMNRNLNMEEISEEQEDLVIEKAVTERVIEKPTLLSSTTPEPGTAQKISMKPDTLFQEKEPETSIEQETSIAQKVSDLAREKVKDLTTEQDILKLKSMEESSEEQEDLVIEKAVTERVTEKPTLLSLTTPKPGMAQKTSTEPDKQEQVFLQKQEQLPEISIALKPTLQEKPTGVKETLQELSLVKPSGLHAIKPDNLMAQDLTTEPDTLKLLTPMKPWLTSLSTPLMNNIITRNTIMAPRRKSITVNIIKEKENSNIMKKKTENNMMSPEFTSHLDMPNISKRENITTIISVAQFL